MNRLDKIKQLRLKLRGGQVSIGSWMQLPSDDVAEIMGDAGYDWVAIDLEHGAIDVPQLPGLCRALELTDTLPLARLPDANPKHCKDALDAGAGGVIVPMVNNRTEVEKINDACCWPPAGIRGVGYSRANLYGKYFDEYSRESQVPIIVTQVEHIDAIENLDDILSLNTIDAIFVGPYDLSASMDLTGQVDHPDVESAIAEIVKLCNQRDVAAGIHVVQPDQLELKHRIEVGYRFIAYSIDAVFLNNSVTCPI